MACSLEQGRVRTATLERMDMHAHSSASRGAAAPLLARIGMAECYSEPERVYDQARARGMTRVTLTDHDTVDGAMELVDRGFPGVVVGEEATVRFPEDGRLLHVLVWGLTGEQHEAIGSLGLRDDVYAFAHWLREEGLAHALAHPLSSVGPALSVGHVERCALLFRAFETLNGAHAASQGRTLERWLAGLTPERRAELALRHGIEPLWPGACPMPTTAGSDDHALLNVGRTWTEVALPAGASFLERVMAGEGGVRGQEGCSELLAHQLATVMIEWGARRLAPPGRGSTRARAALRELALFAGVEVERPSRAARLVERVRRLARPRRRQLPLSRALRSELGPTLEAFPDLKGRLDPRSWATAGPAMADHERMAAFAVELSDRVGAAIGRTCRTALRRGDRRALADCAVSAAGLLAAQAPYLFSLFHQNRERRLLESMERACAGSDADTPARPMRVALFTDTLGDVNGVSRFIADIAARARAGGRDLRALTSTRMRTPDAPNIVNFAPVSSFAIPRCGRLEVVAPPLLRMLRYVDELRPDAVHISTPGPVGATGLIAARMLRVPALGVCHTDFPAFVERLFGDAGLTRLCAEGLRRFYAPFATILTRSQGSAHALASLGYGRERMRTLTPGVDVEAFHPRHRDPSMWGRLGAGVSARGVKALYVGRLSAEKNLAMLARVWSAARRELSARGVEAELLVVGDGPWREAMARSFAPSPDGGGVRFLGFRHGVELSRIYASSDLFLFPSTTDTLGQVVLESQASGVPVIVSDVGGPKEVVDDGITGLVLPASDERAWVEGVVRLASDADLRARLGRTAHVRAQRRSLQASFEQFWQAHADAVRAGRVGRSSHADEAREDQRAQSR